MYKFCDWFLEYMKHIDKFCDKKPVMDTICELLEGHYELLENHPDFISHRLSLNRNAIHILEKHPDKICWSNLSSNSNAIHILTNNQEKINWYWLSINSGAKELILKNLDKIKLNYIGITNERTNHISWKLLHYNHEALEILELYKESINWRILSFINNEKNIEFLFKNIHHINWTYLSFNNCATKIFITYPEYVNWTYLSFQPFAISILTNFQDYIDWDYLSFNENAIELLNKNYEKINWSAILFNKNGIKLIETNLERINWTDWKIFTQLMKKLERLDKKIYMPGVNTENITDIIYELKQNYKNNLSHFGKCFIYNGLSDINEKEIINDSTPNFYVSGTNYSHLIRDKINCVYPTINTYKQNFIKYLLQTDKSFAILIKESFSYIGPPQYNPIYSISNNIEFNDIIKNNPDKIEWILKLLDSFGCDEYVYTQILTKNNIITLDFQKMSIERTMILREELMMKVWHPLNVEKWLNSGFTIDDL